MSISHDRALDGMYYEEPAGSGAITIDDNGVVGTRTYRVAWSDALPFCMALVEKEWVSVDGLATELIYAHPWTLPDGTVLCCSSTVVNGFGRCSGELDIEYEYAIISASFTPQSGNTSTISEETGSISLDYSAEFLTTPKDTWKFSDTGYVVNEPSGILISVTELTVNYVGLPSVPRAGIRACSGCVNAAVWQGAGVGQVLFIGASTSQTIMTHAVSPYNVTLKFKEKVRDWNKVLGKDGAWHTLVDKKTGLVNPYAYADFGALLTF